LQGANLRTALMPDSEEIEPTGTESSKAKLSERGANSRQNFNFSANSIIKYTLLFTNIRVCFFCHIFTQDLIKTFKKIKI
jgi:hypothetical protein